MATDSALGLYLPPRLLALCQHGPTPFTACHAAILQAARPGAQGAPGATAALVRCAALPAAKGARIAPQGMLPDRPHVPHLLCPVGGAGGEGGDAGALCPFCHGGPGGGYAGSGGAGGDGGLLLGPPCSARSRHPQSRTKQCCPLFPALFGVQAVLAGAPPGLARREAPVSSAQPGCHPNRAAPGRLQPLTLPVHCRAVCRGCRRQRRPWR